MQEMRRPETGPVAVHDQATSPCQVHRQPAAAAGPENQTARGNSKLGKVCESRQGQAPRSLQPVMLMR